VHCPATSQHYSLSLHDALPISLEVFEGSSKTAARASNKLFINFQPAISLRAKVLSATLNGRPASFHVEANAADQHVERRGTAVRSEEHTSELQSQSNLVCRLLL